MNLASLTTGHISNIFGKLYTVSFYISNCQICFILCFICRLLELRADKKQLIADIEKLDDANTELVSTN